MPLLVALVGQQREWGLVAAWRPAHHLSLRQWVAVFWQIPVVSWSLPRPAQRGRRLLRMPDLVRLVSLWGGLVVHSYQLP